MNQARGCKTIPVYIPVRLPAKGQVQGTGLSSVVGCHFFLILLSHIGKTYRMKKVSLSLGIRERCRVGQTDSLPDLLDSFSDGGVTDSALFALAQKIRKIGLQGLYYKFQRRTYPFLGQVVQNLIPYLVIAGQVQKVVTGSCQSDAEQSPHRL